MSDMQGFDWGPPTRGSDRLKDYLIYFVIVIVLGFGIWLLLDIRGNNEKPAYSPRMVENVQASESYENKQSQTYSSNDYVVRHVGEKPISSREVERKAPDIEMVYSQKPEFFVQLGAFEDEEAASEIFEFLKDNDFEPILKEPNEQIEIYRVVVGPFNSEADADYRAEKLNELGLPCFVVEY